MPGFVELDNVCQKYIDDSLAFDEEFIAFIDLLERDLGKDRWVSIAKTNIEQGFMALHRGIIELQRSNRKKLHEARKIDK